MKSSTQATNGVAQPAKLNPLTVSERKLKANRENAKKSTGPKTPRGKAFSWRNAVKHGIFVNYVTDFEALDEDPNEYRELLSGLWDQYQPEGRAEEIEVERIALCCWRLKRTWRYENAINLAARRDFVRAELDDQGEYCKEKDKQENALLVELQNAKKEIKDKGEVSQELKERMFGMMPGFEALWSDLEKAVQECFEEADTSRTVPKLSPAMRSAMRDIYVVTKAIALHERMSERRWTNVMETAIGCHAITNPEALDKILRYETTVERYLSRALEQLERLQRRRRGEVVPPSLRVHLG